MSIIGPIVAAARAARAAQIATRITGGIKGAKTVEKIYQEGSAAPIAGSVKSQAQINAEGIAKARQSIGLPAKPTAQEIASRASKEKARLQTPRIKRGN